MSIQTNKMKAVAVLLKRLGTARSKFLKSGRDESFDGKLEKLSRELNKIKDVFVRVKSNEDELLDILTQVDAHLRNFDSKTLDQDMDAICKRITHSAHKLLPMDAFHEETSQILHSLHPSSSSSSTQHNKLLPMDAFDEESSEILHSSRPSSSSSSTQHNNHLPLDQDVDLLWERFQELEDKKLQSCFWTFTIFPEDAVIKKRHAIYWWIGERWIRNTEEKTAEEEGEEVIDELLKLNMIVPYYGNANCPLLNKFQLNPHIRPHLLQSAGERINAQHLGYYYSGFRLVLEQQKVVLSDRDHLIDSVFNVGASYLNFKPQWLAKQKDLDVLQLGRWQDSPSHHIEVGSQEFLKDLRQQKRLIYLSLRGISRISELPPSIAQLRNLEILDLKACHNLETLPDDISSMKHLTHLILSQCYLLDSMPKGIETLNNLQVLKGFLIGSPRKTPCRISDLANLKKLRRLSIHIGTEAVIEDGEFESLGKMPALKHLTISWGVSRYSDIMIILPSRLKKLHLEGFPGHNIPEWLKPSKLAWRFKQLKIIGGKLQSMNHDDINKWGMEIVHLKYLKHLKVELTNLKVLFPLLRYAEIKQISNHSYVEWVPIEGRGKSKFMS